MSSISTNLDEKSLRCRLQFKKNLPGIGVWKF